MALKVPENLCQGAHYNTISCVKIIPTPGQHIISNS